MEILINYKNKKNQKGAWSLRMSGLEIKIERSKTISLKIKKNIKEFFKNWVINKNSFNYFHEFSNCQQYFFY